MYCNRNCNICILYLSRPYCRSSLPRCIVPIFALLGLRSMFLILRICMLRFGIVLCRIRRSILLLLRGIGCCMLGSIGRGWCSFLPVLLGVRLFLLLLLAFRLCRIRSFGRMFRLRSSN